MDNTELARIAYDAYRAHTGGVSLATGQPIPEWPQLRPEIQAAWQASAAAVKMAEPEPGFWGRMATRMQIERNKARAELAALNWKPIDQADPDVEYTVGIWRGGHWSVARIMLIKSRALALGYTHYLPPAAPPPKENTHA